MQGKDGINFNSLYAGINFPGSLSEVKIHYGDFLTREAQEKIIHPFQYGAIRLFTYFASARMFYGKKAPIKKFLIRTFNKNKANKNNFNKNQFNQDLSKEMGEEFKKDEIF